MQRIKFRLPQVLRKAPAFIRAGKDNSEFVICLIERSHEEAKGLSNKTAFFVYNCDGNTRGIVTLEELFKKHRVKISVAQTKPIKGDIQANIENHKLLIDLAVSAGADAIFFPELSLTGYEPTLAAELATDKDDERFDVFQAISDEKKLMIGIGMPTKSDHGILISMIIFQSHQARQIYSKQYIHADEEPYFINADNVDMMTVGEMSFAICYEISIPQHAEHAYQNGSKMYIASVAKSVAGVGKAIETLRATAKKYSMTVVMSNCVGFCDNFECGGRTSVWNNEGFLIGQLNESSEGVLIMDTEKQMVIEKYLETYVSSMTSKG